MILAEALRVDVPEPLPTKIARSRCPCVGHAHCRTANLDSHSAKAVTLISDDSSTFIVYVEQELKYSL
jgi:hypothetical protein